jgi:hypothetical protein
MDIGSVCRPLPAHARTAFFFSSCGALPARRGKRTPQSRIACGFVWHYRTGSRFSQAQTGSRPSPDAPRLGLHSRSSMVWRHAAIPCDGSDDYLLRKRIYDRSAPPEPHLLQVVRVFFEVQANTVLVDKLSVVQTA